MPICMIIQVEVTKASNSNGLNVEGWTSLGPANWCGMWSSCSQIMYMFFRLKLSPGNWVNCNESVMGNFHVSALDTQLSIHCQYNISILLFYAVYNYSITMAKTVQWIACYTYSSVSDNRRIDDCVLQVELDNKRYTINEKRREIKY